MRRPSPLLPTLLLCLPLAIPLLESCAKKTTRKVETVERRNADGSVAEVTVVKEDSPEPKNSGGDSAIGGTFKAIGYVITIPFLVIGGILAVLF